MLIALIAAAPACDRSAEDATAKEAGATGSIHAALTVGGSRHDVVGVHYKVVAVDGSCGDPAIAETTSALEEEALPEGVAPPGAGVHAGADGLFVVPPGAYRVCATPLSSSGPSLECAPAESTASVFPEATSEILLVSQCAGAPNGGLDVIAALNDPPTIEDIDIAPSKYITQCETAAIAVTASDPDGDAISVAWELVSGAGELAGDGGAATFTPAGPGAVTVRVTVTDALGGSSRLSFPLHVSAADCGTPACEVFGTDGFGYVGCARTEEIPSCDDITLTGNVACGGDDCTTTVSLPFAFDFYGTSRAEVTISSNGQLGFPVAAYYGNNCTLEPDTIAPFWDDLLPPGGGAVFYQTLGVAPERRFVVQWNVPHIQGGSLYDIRAVLFEGSNDIRFCYADTTVDNVAVDSGASATAGISGTESSLVYSCYSPQLTDGLALEFSHPGGGGATCDDGIQNQGETGVDCGGPCAPCGGVSVFSFVDTPADDVDAKSLYDFFSSLGTVSSSQYILFEIATNAGTSAWCSENAAFYVDTYIAQTNEGGGGFQSGPWNKYWRVLDGPWSGPDTAPYWNYYAASCDESPYAWCAEWDLGGNRFAVMPYHTVTNGESYLDWSYSNGEGWVVTIAVGDDRLSTCGF
ncbi:Ig-like domain-containing protein [Sorangium sp. So ce134]